ncbi:hypothetical protein [Mycobacterium sp. 3519A]|uniref:hypothetical protein n=1 Tax=Mycobacterium sp. 3519A TaxID=2057184 RepID=UPI0013575C78|nr:hypothetical protein [Mycobacterium sp. 3519A]
MIDVLVRAAMDSAAATGAAAIAVAAAPAMTSGARNFSFAIMPPVYHQDHKLKTANFQQKL